MADLQPSSLRIDSVAFSERGIELTYMEARDETPFVVVIKTVLIAPDAPIDHEVGEAVEALELLLDAALTLMRNPPATKPALGRRGE